jgi:phage-related minor tail protein
MLAVTGFAIVAAIGLIFFAIQRKNAADEADKQAEIDRRAKEEAVKVAAEAETKVEKIQKDLDDLTDKIGKAVDAVATAQNDADRASARSKLQQLQKEQFEMRQRAADAKAAAAKAERARGVHTSAECLANPLAKGCS